MLVVAHTEQDDGIRMIRAHRAGRRERKSYEESSSWRSARPNPGVLPLWHPCQGAERLPRRYPEVAAPRKPPGDVRLPSGNPLGWPLKSVQRPRAGGTPALLCGSVLAIRSRHAAATPQPTKTADGGRGMETPASAGILAHDFPGRGRQLLEAGPKLRQRGRLYGKGAALPAERGHSSVL
jgi:hypothetical protein